MDSKTVFGCLLKKKHFHVYDTRYFHRIQSVIGTCFGPLPTVPYSFSIFITYCHCEHSGILYNMYPFHQKHFYQKPCTHKNNIQTRSKVLLHDVISVEPHLSGHIFGNKF